MIALAPGERLLVYGIGNPGRQDDALGVRFIERLEREHLPATVTLEANYQLTPEDALLLADHDVVVFVDATVEPGAPEPYSLRSLETEVLALATGRDAMGAFSSHALGMATLLALCVQIHGRAPRAFALAIPAYEFEVNADLSPRAAEHLARASADVLSVIGAASRPAAPSVP